MAIVVVTSLISLRMHKVCGNYKIVKVVFPSSWSFLFFCGFKSSRYNFKRNFGCYYLLSKLKLKFINYTNIVATWKGLYHYYVAINTRSDDLELRLKIESNHFSDFWNQKFFLLKNFFMGRWHFTAVHKNADRRCWPEDVKGVK